MPSKQRTGNCGTSFGVSQGWVSSPVNRSSQPRGLTASMSLVPTSTQAAPAANTVGRARLLHARSAAPG